LSWRYAKASLAKSLTFVQNFRNFRLFRILGAA
jgi:hypothetical protein